VTYLVALDESTDIAQLAFYVQSVSEDLQLVEEILELFLMKGDISTDEIFFSNSKYISFIVSVKTQQLLSSYHQPVHFFIIHIKC
jgi:hypothetical protein